MNIEFTIPDGENELKQTYWRFWVRPESNTKLRVYLDIYQEQTRKSKRHKWQNGKEYHRLPNRNVFGNRLMKAEDVPLSDYIKSIVRAELNHSISIELWDQ